MKREAQITTIIDFIMQKENEKVKVSQDVTGYQHFFIDYVAKGQANTEPAVIALEKAQRVLYREIAVAMIDNSKKDIFKGMEGSFNMKRLQAGITFGGGGWAFENMYPKGEFYEYRLHAWIK